MKPLKIEDIIRTDEPMQWANHVAYAVGSLILTARLALENDSSGICNEDQKANAVADVLEIAEALNDVVIEGAEFLQRQTGHGIWKKDDAA
ncbi:hypothetical protein [Paracoccus beibuensis]|uniref:hypothetical protein n=1 Tax=Paracoccus beibuensis TaxID=547602 RepID=UPI00223F495D|nr:hypothetical protein [Paracoccus beibuensis]